MAGEQRMSPCGRGCCWTPYACATTRTCSCHWEERKPGGLTGTAASHRDPTANEAIRRAMKGQKK